MPLLSEGGGPGLGAQQASQAPVGGQTPSAPLVLLWSWRALPAYFSLDSVF